MPSTTILNNSANSISEEQSVPSQIHERHRCLCFCVGFSALQWRLLLRQLEKEAQWSSYRLKEGSKTMLFADGKIFYLENAKNWL